MVKKRIGIDIDEKKHFELKQIALDKKTTLTALVEIILLEWLEREKEKKE